MTEGDDKGREAYVMVACSICGVEVSWQGRGRKPKYCAKCRAKARVARAKRDGTQAIADLPEAEILALVKPGATPPPATVEDDRDGPCLASAKRLFDSIDTEHPAAELLLETIVALAIDIDSADSGPTQRSNSARELRGLVAELVAFQPVVKEAVNDNPFGVPAVSA